MNYTSIETITVVLSIILGLVGVYRFFIRRPHLKVGFHTPNDTLDSGNQLLATFYVRNDGHRYAEDVFVALRTNEWDMDFVLGDRPDELFLSDIDLTWNSFPHETLKDQLDIEVFQHYLFLDQLIYDDVEFEVATRILELEKPSDQTIHYLVACRSHRPRGGKIRLIVDDEGNLTKEISHWSLYERLKYWLETFRPSHKL